MNPIKRICLAIAVLMPASICVADQIRIETKIVKSGFTEIPHSFVELAKLKGVDLMTAPSVTTRFSKSATLEVVRDYIPPSATHQKFESSTTGTTISVTPERQGADIAFKGCLTITELVGEANRAHQTQSETVTRTIYFSGKQKQGDEGWFDLINPTHGSPQKKVTVWIRFEQPNADKAPHANPPPPESKPATNENR